MLSQTIEYANRTRPNVFKGNVSAKVKIAAKSAGLGSWSSCIIEMGKTVEGIEKVKKSNLWDFFDIREHEAKKAIFEEMLR